MIQQTNELDIWHSQADPWGYETHSDDLTRKSLLLSELPVRSYNRVIDIGCGQGFITRDLPGKEVIGIDISSEAIRQARLHANNRVHYQQGSIFELPAHFSEPFDLVVITGVVYPQYVGNALCLIYDVVNQLLDEDGVLVSVHIDQWYRARFPLLRIKEHYYTYREYTHRLEIYVK